MPGACALVAARGSLPLSLIGGGVTAVSDVKSPACEGGEQTGRKPNGRVPNGCDGAAAHNPYTFTGRRLDPGFALMQ